MGDSRSHVSRSARECCRARVSSEKEGRNERNRCTNDRRICDQLLACIGIQVVKFVDIVVNAGGQRLGMIKYVVDGTHQAHGAFVLRDAFATP
jgi:hypothetical protein